jgi:hypothetical protein
MPKNGKMGTKKTKKKYSTDGAKRTGRPPKKKKGRKLRKPRFGKTPAKTK